MASNSSMSTSARRFERIAKGIVRQDVESQLSRHFQQQFFIDKSVFDNHLPDMIETMDDASLSNFFLKFELSVHTTELVRYFSPQSSSKRDFVNLKYLSGKYGYHLCYMALRESALSKKENRSEVADVVHNMEQTAIQNNVHPPDDLFQDPFLTLSSSSTSSPPAHDTNTHRPTRRTTGHDDVPSGQGESTTSRHVSHCDEVENNLRDAGHNFANHKLRQAIQTHIQPLSIGQALRNLHFPLGSCELEPEDKHEDDRTRHEMHRQLSDQHLQGCNCEMCIFAQIISKISLRNDLPDHEEEQDSMAGQDEFGSSNHRLHAHFSGTHLEGCTCQSCQIAIDHRHKDGGVGGGHQQRPAPAGMQAPVSISEESTSSRGVMIINGDKQRNVDFQFNSLAHNTVSMTTETTQVATDGDHNHNTRTDTNDNKIIEDHQKFTENILYRSRTEQLNTSGMPDMIPHSSIPAHKSFTSTHLVDCNCSSCVFLKQRDVSPPPPLSVLIDNHRSSEQDPSILVPNIQSPMDVPSRSSISSSFEGIQESLEYISCDGGSLAPSAMCTNHEGSFSLSTIINIKDQEKVASSPGEQNHEVTNTTEDTVELSTSVTDSYYEPW